MGLLIVVIVTGLFITKGTIVIRENVNKLRHNSEISKIDHFLCIFNIVIWIILLIAKSGEIAHINRSKPHSGEREEAGQGYYTSSVRHGPGSAQFSLRITEQR